MGRRKIFDKNEDEKERKRQYLVQCVREYLDLESDNIIDNWCMVVRYLQYDNKHNSEYQYDKNGNEIMGEDE
jgi:hypothetical protein